MPAGTKAKAAACHGTNHRLHFEILPPCISCEGWTQNLVRCYFSSTMKLSTRHLPLLGQPGASGSLPRLQSQSLLNRKNLPSWETLPIAIAPKQDQSFALALHAPVAWC